MVAEMPLVLDTARAPSWRMPPRAAIVRAVRSIRPRKLRRWVIPRVIILEHFAGAPYPYAKNALQVIAAFGPGQPSERLAWRIDP